MKYRWDINFDNVGLTYPNGKEALKNINLNIKEGEFVSIIGLSGAGKTTLLKTINKINDISSGEIYIGDKSPEAIKHYKSHKKRYLEAKQKIDETGDEASEKSKKDLKKLEDDYKNAKKNKPYYRIKTLKGKEAREYKTHIGMVFQRYNLIYKSSVMNNVLTAKLAQMPKWRALTGIFSKQDKEAAFDALAQVKILETAYQRAEDLSGGQMQRVALARTIAQEARIILADEPVGALDPIMAKSVMDSFLKINRKQGRTTLLNLHHVDLALVYSERIIGVKEGEIVFDGPSEKVTLKVLKEIYGNQLEGFGAHEFTEIKRKRAELKGKK